MSNDLPEGELERRVNKARRWVRVAGARALEAQEDVTPRRKVNNQGLVTELDRIIETYLREKIRSNFPDDRVLGEEFPSRGTRSTPLTWFLDPIDGTAAYSMSLPIWTVCIGIVYEKEPVGGVMWAPGVGDEYYGWKKGPFEKADTGLEDRATSRDSWDEESLLCVRSDMHRRWDVDFVGKCRSLGSSAYHMGLVMDGRAVGAFLGRLRIWDVAAAWGLSAATGFRLRSLSNNDPDRDSFMEGTPSRDPLVFSHQTLLNDVRNRIRAK